MEATAGIKRKPQVEQTEARKRRATESSFGDANDMEGDGCSNVDTDQEREISDSGEDEDPESEDDFLDDVDELSERKEGDVDDGNDEDDEDYDEFEEFKWLKAINIPIKADDTADSPQVGFCEAKLIDRNYIRATFHRDMEEPSNDTATVVGFGVFNRWGCLKPEFLTHPVKKGTGVWGPELNEGRFLLIETLSVEEAYQRKGYGKKLFQEVWGKAQDLTVQEDKDRRAARKERTAKVWEDTRTEGEKPTVIDDDFLDRMDKCFRPDEKAPSGCDFAIVWATVLNTRDVAAEADKLSSTERELFYQRKQDALEDFWRAMGFRRIGSSSFFCLAKDPDHPSHSLLSQDDYIRPAALETSARADDQDFPLMDPVHDPNAWEQKFYNDAETKELLEARLQSYPATDPTWVSTDRHNNNILHMLARKYQAESLAWALRLPFADNLRSARNLEGETPLETLRCQLESDRTWRQFRMAQVVMSDLFSGFTPTQIECLKLLENESPSSDELMRLAFGCSCGECLGGFLSPRNLFALLCQAEIQYDMLNDALDPEYMVRMGIDWWHWREDMFEHLVPSVRDNFRTNKSLRQGFTNIFAHVAETLRAKKLPLTEDVLHYASSEWPPHVRNYLQRGGTVYAVVQACFDCTMNQDIYLGDGDHQMFQKDIEALPACRNDGEFVFARRQYRKLEGLPDEVNPRVGMGGTWEGLVIGRWHFWRVLFCFVFATTFAEFESASSLAVNLEGCRNWLAKLSAL